MPMFQLYSLMREETLLLEPPSPRFQARCRHDLLHCLVIILSYPIMFFNVKNARTLLWLHLGILQHLEDGKKKKKHQRKPRTTAPAAFCVLPFSMCPRWIDCWGEDDALTPRVSLAGARAGSTLQHGCHNLVHLVLLSKKLL